MGIIARVIDLDHLDSKTIESVEHRTIYCFIVATYGDGDPTDNTTRFYKYLKNDLLPANLLRGVQFVVFGLGNKQYRQFNQIGRFINGRLADLGAVRFHDYGEGDESGSLENDFISWQKSLLTTLSKQKLTSQCQDRLTIPPACSPSTKHKFEWIDPPYLKHLLAHEGRYVQSSNETLETLPVTNMVSKCYWKTEPFKIKRIIELVEKHPNTLCDHSVLHVELELPRTIEHYETASNLSIIPENSPESIEQVATALGWQEKLDQWFSLSPTSNQNDDVGYLFPTPCTLRTAFSCYCAINSLIDYDFIEHMISFMTNNEYRTTINRLLTEEAESELKNMIHCDFVSVLEFIQQFGPWNFENPGEFFAICPRLQSRDYTISSSAKVFPRIVHVTMSVEVKSLKVDKHFYGVCTGSMNRRFRIVQDSDMDIPPVFAFLKKSSFRLPPSSANPMIMIGPGTGIAPMRALIQERAWQKTERGAIGKCLLFFGCRNKDEFIYRNELEEFVNEGVITTLNVAFSREESKVYVQDLLKENVEEIWGLVYSSNAYVYICGGSKMGKAVYETFVNMAMDIEYMTETNARKYFADLATDGRLMQELWS
jgi:NADPH-ferrihemoprotein reductase